MLQKVGEKFGFEKKFVYLRQIKKTGYIRNSHKNQKQKDIKETIKHKVSHV